jgi:uncharacterized protein YoaH (UPF0181 family)
MPNLTREQQRDVGGRLASIIEPFPRDERLLLLLAGFYGESCKQGLSAGQAIDLAIRTIKIHERGLLPAAVAVQQVTCPSCGGVL